MPDGCCGDTELFDVLLIGGSSRGSSVLVDSG
jgi:hypothetical protein